MRVTSYRVPESCGLFSPGLLSPNLDQSLEARNLRMSVQASLDLDCDMLYSVDALEYRKVLVLAVDLNLVVAVETCRKGGGETPRACC
jgi:hypothetical protein